MVVINDYKTKWDLTPLLQSDNDPNLKEKLQTSIKKCKEFISTWEPRTDYLNDPEVLKTALDEFEILLASYGISGDVGFYFFLRGELEQNNPKIKAQKNKINEVSVKIQNDLNFFTHRISKISQDQQSKFLNAAHLQSYKHFLENLFLSAKYLLSESEEKILNLKSQTSYENWVNMTSEFISREEAEILDEEEKLVTKNFTEIWSLTSDKNKKVRDSAIKAANHILEKYSDVAEAEINSILRDKQINDELRNLPRPDMAQHLSDDIDTEIVDQLIKSVSENFKLSHKFYQLKSKLLGIPKLTYFERNIKYGELDGKYPFEQAIDLVGSVFNKLDSEFFEIFNNYLKNGQIDVFPVKSKTSSEFSIHGLKSQPGYILLSYTSEIDDVTTLAHEMGHAINNELTKSTQNSLYFDTPLCTAEVASTFMEDFVLNELEGRLGDEAKLSIMFMRATEAANAIFRQVACYMFEQELHTQFRAKGFLSKTEIGEIFVKHMKNYLGDSVDMTDGSQNWWIYWSHIRAYFYVYSYASGVLISKSLQNMVKANKENILKVKEFLKAGLSDSPKNIFLKVGVDISDPEFWNKGLGEVENLLNDIESLATKLGKI